jgi:hypothetical protein
VLGASREVGDDLKVGARRRDKSRAEERHVDSVCVCWPVAIDTGELRVEIECRGRPVCKQSLSSLLMW